METIKINNKILTFEKILYVDVDGNNETGDGSYNNPYQSLDKALLEAQDNYCIFIRRGTYRLKPITIVSGYSDGGIYDYGKALTIIGENEKTVLEFYGSDGKERDNCLMGLTNPNSLLAKLKINYYPPNKSTNYSKAIAIASKGTIKNVIIENISKISWSYSYYNDAPANSPKFENCIFISHGYSTSDFTGNPLYTNCLFDVTPSRGTRQYCITRTITEEDLQKPTKDSDLYCSGNPNTFNPDGTQAHIGVYGGEFAWGNWKKSLLKSNNKYYTYQNNEFIEVEPTVENFKEKSIYLSDLTTPNENGIKPYKLLDKPSIVTYTEDEKIPILSQTVIASTKVRFLVSKDKINYQIYRNGKWITIDKDNILEQGMTKLELESIPQEAWAEWVENEAHKHSFDILIGMYSESPNPIIRSITVNYAENESPIIINAYIEPDTIHNEFAMLKAHVKDYEGDRISFKVLIKKAGTDEFVQVSPLEGWYNRNASETEITQAFNFPYFNPGENEVKLVVKDERGAEAEWTGRVILSNTNPTITLAYDDFSMRATIGDDDNDMVAYRIAINGELIFDYTDFTPTKTYVNYVFDTSKLKFGEENTITIEAKDTHGGYAKEEFTVIGSYRGLMFKNENGEYFVDDKGEILMDLLFGKTLIGGQTSETKKVILENRHEFPITNVQITPENPNFTKGAVLEISETEMPFTPKDVIKVLEIMPSLGEKDFYVRVKTTREAHQGGYFYIKSTASPVLE